MTSGTPLQYDPYKPWTFRYPNKYGEFIVMNNPEWYWRTFEEAVTVMNYGWNTEWRGDWEIYNVKTGERTPFAILQVVN